MALTYCDSPCALYSTKSFPKRKVAYNKVLAQHVLTTQQIERGPEERYSFLVVAVVLVNTKLPKGEHAGKVKTFQIPLRHLGQSPLSRRAPHHATYANPARWGHLCSGTQKSLRWQGWGEDRIFGGKEVLLIKRRMALGTDYAERRGRCLVLILIFQNFLVLMFNWIKMGNP